MTPKEREELKFAGQALEEMLLGDGPISDNEADEIIERAMIILAILGTEGRLERNGYVYKLEFWKDNC